MSVAQALCVDTKRGPYPALLGMENCWGVERGVENFSGPGPVVAHPPCGPYGRYAFKCKQDARLAPLCVGKVRQFGGVLEHPKDSKLWAACMLPRPGEPADGWGGYTILVFQRDFGHAADKPTWLYVVGCPAHSLPPSPPPVAPREAWQDAKRNLGANPKNGRPRGTRGVLERMSKLQRHLTPPSFAAWLVEVAERCRHA